MPLIDAYRDRYGVSVVRFDYVGALLAVASSSGLIRVFDFDEFLFQEHLALSPHIRALVALDTRKAIADIQWSDVASTPDFLYVSYLHSSDIEVYDISDISLSGSHSGSAIIKLQVKGRCVSLVLCTPLSLSIISRYRRLLLVLLEIRLCANIRKIDCSLDRLRDNFDCGRVERHAYFGKLMSQTLFMVNVSLLYTLKMILYRVTVFLFCISLDVHGVIERHSIVRIHLCRDFSVTDPVIVTVTRSGIISTWDPSQLTVKSFGNSRIPHCISRFSVHEIQHQTMIPRYVFDDIC
jgi:hypothetical protein